MGSEDLGLCIGCNKPLRVGDVVTPWDDEVGHANCDNPTSFDVSHLAEDPDMPPAMVLLDYPARYISLAHIKLAENEDKRVAREWQLLQNEMQREAQIREAAAWSSQ